VPLLSLVLLIVLWLGEVVELEVLHKDQTVKVDLVRVDL
jgi:hypothetical protein